MLKIIVASVAALGMTAAHAGSIGNGSQGSAASTTAAYAGSTAGSITTGQGFSDALKGASQLNSQAIANGTSGMMKGSADVIVTGIHFGVDSSKVSFQFAKESATFVVEMATPVAQSLYNGSKAVLKFVYNTAVDGSVTVSGQMVLSLEALSQGNLEASVQNIVLMPKEALEALMTPDSFYADKYNRN